MINFLKYSLFFTLTFLPNLGFSKSTKNLKPVGDAIKNQSFEIELSPWGKVYFASYEEINGQSRVNFYLLDQKQNDKIIYVFPDFYKNSTWSFESLEAIAFKDLNNDYLTDVIIIAHYITGMGPEGLQPFRVVGAYKNTGTTFEPYLINTTTKNSLKTVNDVVEYFKKNKL